MTESVRDKILGPIGVLVFVFLFVGYWYLKFTGWEHPLARVIGVYHHRVSTFPQYCERLMGEDLFEMYNASVLSFDCGSIRDDFTSSTHTQLVTDNRELFGGPGPAWDEIIRLRLLGAWREGDVLHFANAYASDVYPLSAAFTEWKEQMADFVTKDVEVADEHFCSVKTLQTLFTKVWIHGGEDENASFDVPGVKFQACKRSP